MNGRAVRTSFRTSFGGVVMALVASASLLVVSVPRCMAQDAAVPAPTQDSGAAAPAPAQSQASAPASSEAEVQGGTIRGSAKSGAVPLPGVAITATNTLTGKKYTTSTDASGAFEMTIPRNGRYVVRAELAAFAADTKEILLNATQRAGTAEFTLQLASRAAAAQQSASSSTSSQALARGLQSLGVTGLGGGDTADASASTTGNSGASLPTLSGIGGDNATESVAVQGQAGTTTGLANFNEDEIRDRIQDALQRARQSGGGQSDITSAVVGALGGMMSGGGAMMIGGGGGGGRGGRGGGGGGFRNMDPTQIHGNLFYQGGNAALDATQFSVAGDATKPGYSSNKYGASFTGSPFIPGLIKPSAKQFVFVNLTGSKTISPVNETATVPTLAERVGDFSTSTQTVNGAVTPVTIYDPLTGQPFTGNVLPANRLTSQALSLLSFYPTPNVVGTGTQRYNYQRITTAGNNSVALNTRFIRNFGSQTGRGMMGMFGGGGGGGRDGRSSQQQKSLRQNVNVGFNYQHSANDTRGLVAVLDGKSQADNYNVSTGYSIGYGRLQNNATVTWNRSHTLGTNFFTNGSIDPAAAAGLNIPRPVAPSPGFYNGLPSLSLANFGSFSETTPTDNIGQTISFSDFVSWGHGKHNYRFGVDLRRVHADSVGGNNVMGTYTFTGYATQAPGTSTGTQQSATGSSFADFLLGAPQQSSLQAGLYKRYLRETVLDWYAQDDWRILPSVTLQLGLRYEYFAPYTEKNNHLVNLDHNADFTQVATVLPGQVGQFEGKYPKSLINPDRSMFAPRFGVAWRVPYVKQTVVRAGYGLNYNTGQFATFATSLSAQQPFSVTQTNIAQQQGCGNFSSFTLANAFGCSSASVQSNFAVNRFYRLGRVQVWNVDIQHTLPMNIVMNVGYNGGTGGDLDIRRAPNSTATGSTTSSAQAFAYEDSVGFSRYNAFAASLRKRMQKGIALSATYTYGHSIDNASSVGGSGGNTIPQDDQRLDLEEGNSSFDVRHKVSGEWVLELPFGPNRAFLAQGGLWSKAMDGFSLSGDYTFATGTYFTPQYQSTVAQTASGGLYTLRPDRIFSQSISGAGRLGQWFNPGAFASPAGEFGTASRNSIRGPGTVIVDMSLSKTVSFGSLRSFEARVTASNALNTVQYSGVNTTLNSATFGQVTNAAAPRKLTFVARYRF